MSDSATHFYQIVHLDQYATGYQRWGWCNPANADALFMSVWLMVFFEILSPSSQQLCIDNPYAFSFEPNEARLPQKQK